MDDILEILSTVLRFLIVIVPIFLYSLFRKRLKGRPKGKRSKSGAFIKRVEEFIQPKPFEPPEEKYPEPLKFTPEHKKKSDPIRGTHRVFGEPPPYSMKKTAAKAEPSEHPLDRISRYPVGKRAVIFSEIIGKPKGLQ